MSKVSDDPRIYLREALALSERALERPGDKRVVLQLAVKVQAIDEALQHGAYKLVRRT
jgi:hypothetical protein